MNHVITETPERTLSAVCLCVGITVLVCFLTEGQWSEHEQINREKTNIQEENI